MFSALRVLPPKIFPQCMHEVIIFLTNERTQPKDGGITEISNKLNMHGL